MTRLFTPFPITNRIGTITLTGNDAQGAQSGSAVSYTFTLGADRLGQQTRTRGLLLAIGANTSGGNRNISSVTMNSDPMNLQVPGSNSQRFTAFAWSMIAAGVTSATIVVTFTATSTDAVEYCAMHTFLTEGFDLNNATAFGANSGGIFSSATSVSRNLNIAEDGIGIIVLTKTNQNEVTLAPASRIQKLAPRLTASSGQVDVAIIDNKGFNLSGSSNGITVDASWIGNASGRLSGVSFRRGTGLAP